MYRGFRDDTLLSGGSIVVLGEYCWNHNIQGYALIENEEENVFQQSCLRIHILKYLVDG